MLSHPHHHGFQAAAMKEYGDLVRQNTFKKISKTPTTKTIPLLWVFTYKLDTDGYLIKYKARLCVHKDLQKPTY